jgi:ferrochelatase
MDCGYQKKTGILLVNLGTPKTPHPKDVYRYLIEFLTDGRVIDWPWLKRQLFVRGFLVPFRYKQSAKLYQKLWTPEGAPLLVHGLAVAEKLQTLLGKGFKVVLGMRYQEPSIQKGMEALKEEGVDEILIFPLFPQYASATTGSVNEQVMDYLKKWEAIPRTVFINNYAAHPALIKAFCLRAKQYDIGNYCHVLFSFHGLPERQLQKGNPGGSCMVGPCCQKMNSKNQFCYKAQCYATAHAIIKELALDPSSYTICFQSRLGKEPWIQPYTSDVLDTCAEKGHKHLLVFSPSFVCDCLETTSEISYEYAEEFKKKGGKSVQLVEGLNSHPAWIEAIREIINENIYSKSNE